MASYCTEADVRALLPDEEDYESADITAWISRASDYVQGGLEPNYWPLPSTTDDPSTPEAAREATAFRAAYLALWSEGATNAASADSRIERLKQSCEEILTAYNGPTAYRQLPQAQIVGEVLAFGLGTAADETDLAFLDHTQSEVIPESAEIDGYENGIDFKVYYSPRHRRWVVQRLNSEIVDDDTISYRISWLKTRERTSAPSRFGGEIMRA